MALFGKSDKQKRAQFTARAEDLAGSAQLELYKCAKEHIDPDGSDPNTGVICAALANYVFQFGYEAEVHKSNPKVLEAMHAQKRGIFATLTPTFRSNTTGVLILLAAAWQIDLQKFKLHMNTLANDGIAKIGANTPNVQRDLIGSDTVYMYELASM